MQDIMDDLNGADHDERSRNAFGWLPNAVIRDTRVSARLLTITAYRCTFADERRSWGVSKVDVKRTMRIGGGTFYRALSSASKLGLWERRQTIGRDKNGRIIPGRYGRAAERLTLPYQNPENKRQDSQHIRREWFSNVLRPEEWSVLLLRHGGRPQGTSFCRRGSKAF